MSTEFERRNEPATEGAFLTIVSVVFEAEIELLRLQAISISKYVDPSGVRAIMVIDNTASGLSRTRREGLVRAYGSFAPLVRFIRAQEIGSMVSATGWRAQQALKLLISGSVETPWYLALDAKVHFISATSVGSFIGAFGVPKGGVHSYVTHPLRPMLRVVLGYMSLDIETYEAAFTSTATPFLLRSDTARELVRDVGSRNNGGFSAEFERVGLTEFFLYSAWQIAHGRRLKDLVTGESIESPTVWPGHRTASDLNQVLTGTRSSAITTLAIHRTALARMDTGAQAALAHFWFERGLFETPRHARTLIRRFRRAYYPAMVGKKAREFRKRNVR